MDRSNQSIKEIQRNAGKQTTNKKTKKINHNENIKDNHLTKKERQYRIREKRKEGKKWCMTWIEVTKNKENTEKHEKENYPKEKKSCKEIKK